jgi:hypothetical protein
MAAPGVDEESWYLLTDVYGVVDGDAGPCRVYEGAGAHAARLGRMAAEAPAFHAALMAANAAFTAALGEGRLADAHEVLFGLRGDEVAMPAVEVGFTTALRAGCLHAAEYTRRRGFPPATAPHLGDRVHGVVSKMVEDAAGRCGAAESTAADVDVDADAGSDAEDREEERAVFGRWATRDAPAVDSLHAALAAEAGPGLQMWLARVAAGLGAWCRALAVPEAAAAPEGKLLRLAPPLPDATPAASEGAGAPPAAGAAPSPADSEGAGAPPLPDATPADSEGTGAPPPPPAAGAAPSPADSEGEDPTEVADSAVALLYAVALGGCCVNQQRRVDGYTPLHLACLAGLPHLVAVLLACGADVNAVALDDATPLSCVREGEASEGIAAAAASAAGVPPSLVAAAARYRDCAALVSRYGGKRGWKAAVRAGGGGDATATPAAGTIPQAPLLVWASAHAAPASRGPRLHPMPGSAELLPQAGAGGKSAGVRRSAGTSAATVAPSAGAGHGGGARPGVVRTVISTGLAWSGGEYTVQVYGDEEESEGAGTPAAPPAAGGAGMPAMRDAGAQTGGSPAVRPGYSHAAGGPPDVKALLAARAAREAAAAAAVPSPAPAAALEPPPALAPSLDLHVDISAVPMQPRGMPHAATGAEAAVARLVASLPAGAPVAGSARGVGGGAGGMGALFAALAENAAGAGTGGR